MLGAKLGRSPGDPSIDRHDLDAETVDEFVHPGAMAVGERANERLAVGARRHRQRRPVAFAQCGDRPLVMDIEGVEESDRDAGVQRYRSHSPRSFSR